MREIKFRAWDGRKMIEHVGVVPSKPWYSIDTLKVRDEVYYNPYKVNLMQFTGLKDKNGKEIYEGDVMQFGGLRLQVEWSGEGWEPFLNGGDEMSVGETPEHGEVIGNIYENKELLTS